MPTADLAFALVPPGTHPRHRDGEEPQTVHITKAVHWQTTPVTIGLYQAYRAATGRDDDPRLEIWRGDWEPGPTFNQANHHRDDVPVVGTSFPDTTAFLAWLRDRDGRPYRLPTEAELEHAAHAGCRSDGACGCVPQRQHTGISWPEAFLTCWNYAVQQPNAYGIHGLSGVIWYWCSDWYAPYPHTAAVTDPRGPQTRPTSSQWKGRTMPPGRVIRGGSFSYPPEYGRCSNRHFSLPDDRNVNLGFRIVFDA